MHALIPTEHSVFLDATELHSTSAYVTPPVHIEPTLARISYYVSRLTVEELTVQRHQEYSRQVKPALGQYSRLISSTGVVADLDHFREGIVGELMKVPCLKIIDVAPHGSAEQRLLFEARHHGAYKDAMIFASAVAYATSKSLPRCSFITQDKKEKDFAELQRVLSRIHPISLMTREAFKEMVSFNATLYENIIARLRPSLENQVTLLRRELVKRALSHPQSFVATPEAIDFIDGISGPGSDLSSIISEVRNIVVGASGVNQKSAPSNVSCRMIVRYSIPNLWARLYSANASAALSYSGQGDLTDAQVTDFNLDWKPFA